MRSVSDSSTSTPKKPAVWPLAAMPVLVIGGIFLTAYLGLLSDFYADELLPFLLSIWIGMGFSFAWDSVRYSMLAEKVPPLMIAATGVLSGLVVLSMLGWSTLWEDPWILGVAVWPGFSMARPVLERSLGSRPNARQSRVEQPPAPPT